MAYDNIIANFSPDGHKQIAFVDNMSLLLNVDNSTRQWPVFPSTQELIGYANKIVPRCLTKE